MRKLNENCVKLNVSSIKRDYPTLKINTMRDQFINAGASVTSEERESSINEGADDLYMVVNSLNESTVLTMCESIGIEDPEYYVDEFDETEDEEFDESEDFEEFDELKDVDDLEEDYDEDEVRDVVNNIIETMDHEEIFAEGAAEDILDQVLEYFPYPKNHEELLAIINEVIAEESLSIDDTEDSSDDLDDMDDELDYPDYEDVDIDEEDSNEFDDALDSVEEDITEDEWDEDDELYDYDEFDEEVFEKKQPCCPPKKGKMVNLSESLKKLTVTDILNDARKNVTLNESIKNKAIAKAKAAKLASIKESLGTEKSKLVIAQAKARKPFLYENKKINGKLMSEYTTNELLDLLEKAKTKKANTLNESEDFSKVERLLNILDEELSYRLTIEKYLKEDEEVTDPFAMLSLDPNDNGSSDSEENKEEKSEETSEESSEESTEEKTKESDEKEDEDPEEDETAELSRIIITLANKEAADDLKQSLLDEGVPEEAIEIEEDEEESEEDETSEEDTTEETSEESSEESTEESSEETSESIHYERLRRLFEDGEEESSEESSSENGTSEETTTEETSEETPEEDGASEESEESEEEKETEGSVKLILVDTDYTDKLQSVLKNIYGIEEDEFEEMIGGKIVEEDEDDKDSEEGSEESEESEESKEDSSDESGDGQSEADKAADEMDPTELFNGL